ncbi:hypothetical protein [Bacillus sp. XF8]|uniref:hypothetical protein n=1 Tax=Bacillus sp. XF8 TaxID=2819289 RepID=UPI001AA02AF6|nr:hypothetical protein [Bacillus sp. XF8]MBO1582678.1 hypothetical protein [Bacillus sp. XF8]
MAKLTGVKVVNKNTVEYNGFVYGLVADDAQANDLLRFKEDYTDIDIGAFYAVKRIDSDGDVEILDNDNDEQFFDIDDSGFDVFRKSHTTNTDTTDKLTDAEGVVTITSPDGSKIVGTPSDLNKIIHNWQALQAEQVAAVEMPEEAVEVEDASESVSERLQVGDYAKVVGDGNGVSTTGDIVKIIADDGSGCPFKTEYVNGNYAGWRWVKSLVKATDEEVLEAKQALLKVNDYARVIGVTHTEDTCSEHSYKNGDVIELVRYDDEDDTFKTKYLDGSEALSPWVHRKDLEPLTKEETEHIAREAEEEKKARAEREEKEAERLKWAAIGREVGELRNGDTVHLAYCDLLIGKVLGLNEKHSSPSEPRYYVDFGERNHGICTEKASDLVLIAPSESLFNQAPVTEAAERFE